MLFEKNIQIEKDYSTFVIEILKHYPLPIKVKFVLDVFEWQKTHNCLISNNQSCFTVAATVSDTEGNYIILINKEISEDDISGVKSRIKNGDLLNENKEFIKHLVLHEICHVIISLNRKDQVTEDLCDTWAFNEIGMFKRNNCK